MDTQSARQTTERQTPQPTTPFISRSHALALKALEQGVRDGQGMTVIIGDMGVGKTTIVTEFFRQLNDPRLMVTQLSKTPLTFDSILTALAIELNISDPRPDLPMVHQALIDASLAGRQMALVIDDAHHVPIDVLAQLTQLANLESTGTRLLHLVLLGRPELADTLDQPALQSLLPFIAGAVQLSPLTAEESAAFIRHQFRDVIDTDTLFSKSALACIAQHSGGMPQDLIILCTDVINVALSERKTTMRTAMVKEILGDYRPSRQPRRGIQSRLRLPSRLVTSAIAAGLVAAVAWGMLALNNRETTPALAQATTIERPAPPTTQRFPAPEQQAESKPASKGEHIRQLQLQLAAAGFNPGPIDGIMGPQTELALRQYQAANGLNGSKQLRRATHKDLQL